MDRSFSPLWITVNFEPLLQNDKPWDNQELVVMKMFQYSVTRLSHRVFCSLDVCA